jgi:ribosomal protein S12 methylthiotransferase accessory factor
MRNIGTVTGATTVKGFRRGTDRVLPPQRTLQRVSGLFGPMGITRVANITGLDSIGVPVVQVCRPNSRSVSVSQGKGIDLDAARASGVMEAIELFHAERVLRPLKLGSCNELRASHRLVDVAALPRTSVSPFHANHPLLWIEGLDLFCDEPAWVPFEVVHMNFTKPLPTGSTCFVMGSNGLASGNHVLEALCHALCEVIERDAVTLFRCLGHEAQANRRVNPETIGDPDAKRLLDLYERADLALDVWDLTSDVGVPVFRCCIADRSANSFRPLPMTEGSGCHPVPEVALIRALTEAAQGRLTLIAGARDDLGRHRHADHLSRSGDPFPHKRDISNAGRSFAHVQGVGGDTFEQDLRTLLDALVGVGIEQVVAVDLTRPEFGIPVVRVVVPGLESHPGVQGLVPGRRAQRVLADRAAKS